VLLAVTQGLSSNTPPPLFRAGVLLGLLLERKEKNVTELNCDLALRRITHLVVEHNLRLTARDAKQITVKEVDALWLESSPHTDCETAPGS
jgi:hypothetical protein